MDRNTSRSDSPRHLSKINVQGKVLRCSSGLRVEGPDECGLIASGRALADNEQYTVVLGINASVVADGERRVCRAKGFFEEQPTDQAAVPVDGIDVPVFAVGQHGSVPID